MTITTILFDFGQVLSVRSSRGEFAAHARAAAAEFNVFAGALLQALGDVDSQLLLEHGQITTAEYRRRMLEPLGLDPAAQERLFARLFEPGNRIDSEMRAMLIALKAAGYRLGLLSNAGDWLRQDLGTLFAIDGQGRLFDAIVISAEVGVRKPDPRIYRIALERISCRPAECVFIDDQLKNVEAARALGMCAVVFTGPAALWEALDELGVQCRGLQTDGG
jgi:putative hydrolase of the HAD superfamily